MTTSFISVLRSLGQLFVFAVVAIAVLMGLFIVWWIALLGFGALLAYLAVKRLFGAGAGSPTPGSPQAPVVIEGEYTVESEPAERPRTLKDQ